MVWESRELHGEEHAHPLHAGRQPGQRGMIHEIGAEQGQRRF